jgi:hypothetical protein
VCGRSRGLKLCVPIDRSPAALLLFIGFGVPRPTRARTALAGCHRDGAALIMHRSICLESRSRATIENGIVLCYNLLSSLACCVLHREKPSYWARRLQIGNSNCRTI